MSLKAGGFIFIFSSPSGAGKTTLVKLVTKKKNFLTSISHTTRKPRSNEKEGKDYHFVRVDNDGNMSHKDGVKKVSRYIKTYQNKNNKVKKYKLNRKNLKIFEKLGGKICQSFCVPDLPNKLNYKTNFYKNNDCPLSKNKDQIDKKNIKDKRLYYYFKYLEDPKKYKNNKYLKNYIS